MVERFEAKVWLPVLWVGSLLSVILASLWPETGGVDEAMKTLWWNVGHVPAYGVLTLLTLAAAAQRISLSPAQSLALTLVLTLLGVLLEALQPYFGRTADLLDAMHNLLGALLALGVFYLSRWWQGAHHGAG